MNLSRYLKIFPSKEKPGYFLLYSTLRNSTVLVSGATLSAALSGSKMGKEGETLRQLGMLVDHPSLEREQIRTLLQRVNSTSRRFRAVAVLNLDCNLNCDYCYEGEFRGGQYMSRDIAQLLVQHLEEKIAAGLDLDISFYGGEPLLSVDLIHFISEPLQQAAKEKGTRFNFDLVTNGTLLNREMAQRLIPLGLVSAKFTLDGPREIHDRQRPFVSGAGSFDVIVRNMAEVCDLIGIVLGGNCREENYREFPRLLDHLVEVGLTGEKIPRVLFTPVTPKAGCAEHGSDCASGSAPWLIEAIPYLRQATMERGFAPPPARASACIVEFENNIVVNYDGSLYKCPAFMGYEGYSIGNIATGVLDYTESHAIARWQNDECLDCPYLPICFGGCRFINLLNDKPATEVDCRREFYDAALERLVLMNISRLPRKESPPPKESAAYPDYCI